MTIFVLSNTFTKLGTVSTKVNESANIRIIVIAEVVTVTMLGNYV